MTQAAPTPTRFDRGIQPVPAAQARMMLDLRSRHHIEQTIEQLIGLLDTSDGDCDLEDDDPAGDPLDHGEADYYLPDIPLYGIDQDSPPINEREAVERFYDAGEKRYLG